MEEDLRAALALVRGKVAAVRASPALVAVDGPSGSGKSTLARPLAERSKGHRDAGAVSFALAARTLRDLAGS